MLVVINVIFLSGRQMKFGSKSHILLSVTLICWHWVERYMIWANNKFASSSWVEGFHQCLLFVFIEPKMKKTKSIGKWCNKQTMEDYTHVCIWYGIGLWHFRMQKESFHASWVMKEQGMIHSKHNAILFPWGGSKILTSGLMMECRQKWCKFLWKKYGACCHPYDLEA